MIIELVGLPAVGKTTLRDEVARSNPDFVSNAIKLSRFHSLLLVIISMFFWRNLMDIIRLSKSKRFWSFSTLMFFISRIEYARRSSKTIIFGQFYLIEGFAKMQAKDDFTLKRFFRNISKHYGYSVVFLKADKETMVKRAKMRGLKRDFENLSDPEKSFSERTKNLDKAVQIAKPFLKDYYEIDVEDKSKDDLNKEFYARFDYYS